MDYLKSIGFMETNGSTNKGPGKVFTIPASVSIAEIKIQHKKLMSSLDNYLIVINDTMDIINEINKFYQQCMDNIQNDSNSTDEKQPKITSEIASATTMTTPNSNTVNNRVLGIKSHVDPVISHMIPICLQHLASPYKLYEIVKTLYRNIKHMLGVLLNKNLNVKYTGDRWKCWICNKSNNSILRDITCPQCGDGSINPHFFGIQTESSNINCNGKLECGIAKLTVYKNKNNKKTSINVSSQNSAKFLSLNPNAIRVTVNSEYNIFFNQGDIKIGELKQIVFDITNYDMHGRYSSRYILDEFEFTRNCPLYNIRDKKNVPFPADGSHTYNIVRARDFIVHVGFKDEYRLNYNHTNTKCFCPMFPDHLKLNHSTRPHTNDRNTNHNTNTNSNTNTSNTHSNDTSGDSDDDDEHEMDDSKSDVDTKNNDISDNLQYCSFLQEKNADMKINSDVNSVETHHHLEFFNHHNQSKCHNGKLCVHLQRLKNGNFSQINYDRTHLLIYWHPSSRNIHLSTKHLKYFKNFNAFTQKKNKSSRASKSKTIHAAKTDLNTQPQHSSNTAPTSVGQFVNSHKILTIHQLQAYNDESLVVLLIQEVILNGFESDLKPRNKTNINTKNLHSLNYDLARQCFNTLFDILIEKMMHPFHKKMGEPLNKAMVLSLILFTSGKLKKDFNESFIGLGNNKINQKWIVFDFCLYNAIWRLSERENQSNNLVYTCITDINLNLNVSKKTKNSKSSSSEKDTALSHQKSVSATKLKDNGIHQVKIQITSKITVTKINTNTGGDSKIKSHDDDNDNDHDNSDGWGYFVSYQSFTPCLSNVQNRIGDKGVIFGGKQHKIIKINNYIVEAARNSKNGNDSGSLCYSCNVSWISPFPNEEEVVFTRGMLLPISTKSMHQNDGSKTQLIGIDVDSSLVEIFGSIDN